MFGHYFMKMFVPYGISPFHVFTPASTMMTIVMMVLLAALAAIGWKIRHHRALLFLLGFAVLTIAPTLNLRGIGENVFADRYLYIPSLASCILVPAAVYAACKTWAARPAWLDYRIGAVVLVLVLVSSGWMLSGELAIWRNNPTLYHETIRRSPEAALIAHNLGRDYYYKGDIQNAKLWETKAYELWNRTFAKSTGTLTNITIGLGGILYQEGRIAEARDYFMKAYELAPNSEAILQNLGTVSLALRDYQKALQYYDAALKLNPNSEVTYSNLAAIYLSAGQFDQAIANAQRALEIFPRFGDAGANLARAYNAKGMKAEAFAAYEKLKIITHQV
jgi:tetratricopeptide (TPR) repeat protein